MCARRVRLIETLLSEHDSIERQEQEMNAMWQPSPDVVVDDGHLVQVGIGAVSGKV